MSWVTHREGQGGAAVMAESERKSLVWDIRKSLFTLSDGELFQIAKDVGPVAGQGQPELNEEDQEGCFDYISSFMHSNPLFESEYSGMVELLILKDCIDAVIKNQDELLLSDVRGDAESDMTPITTQTVHSAYNEGDVASSPPQSVPVTVTDDTTKQSQPADTASHSGPISAIFHSSGSDSSTASQVESESAKMVSDIKNTELQEMLTSHEELGRKLRQSMMVPSEQSPQYFSGSPFQANKPHGDVPQHDPSFQYIAQPAREGTITLRDLSYLQRREFKVQWGQVGDHSSDINYDNICKQVDEGIREGFHDTEIIRGVLRIIKPGTFKDVNQ